MSREVTFKSMWEKNQEPWNSWIWDSALEENQIKEPLIQSLFKWYWMIFDAETDVIRIYIFSKKTYKKSTL